MISEMLLTSLQDRSSIFLMAALFIGVSLGFSLSSLIAYVISRASGKSVAHDKSYNRAKNLKSDKVKLSVM